VVWADATSAPFEYVGRMPLVPRAMLNPEVHAVGGTQMPPQFTPRVPLRGRANAMRPVRTKEKVKTQNHAEVARRVRARPNGTPPPRKLLRHSFT